MQVAPGNASKLHVKLQNCFCNNQAEIGKLCCRSNGTELAVCQHSQQLRNRRLNRQGASLPQNAQEATAAAAAAAVVREAAASAVVDQLEGESEEEKASRLAAAKEDKMRKVIRCGVTLHAAMHATHRAQPCPYGNRALVSRHECADLSSPQGYIPDEMACSQELLTREHWQAGEPAQP